MADTNGYIKLHRSILSWEWYGDIKTWGLFLHLLVAAQWEDVRIEGQVIKRGQLCTSIRKLADVVGLSERGVRTSLQRLQSTGEITMQSNQHHSIITVVNYDLYFPPLKGRENAEVLRQFTITPVQQFSALISYRCTASGSNSFKFCAAL